MRLRYSLRSALLFVLVFALACSWLAVKMRQADKQRQAVQSLRELNAWCLNYDYQVDGRGCEIPNAQPRGPQWLRRLLGDDFFNDLVEASLHSDAQAEYLEDLPHLTRLDLVQHRGPSIWSEHDVTDAGLQHVKPLVRLRKLNLSCARITDAGLSNVAGMNQLEELDLTATEVTDAGLKCLSGMTRLKWLYLAETKVGDGGLDNLKGLTGLTHLDLARTAVTDAGLEHLKALSHLESLILYGTEVGDGGLAHLSGLKHLTHLNLGATKVTDAGLDCLKGLNQLEYVILFETRATDSRVKRLRQELPNCAIRDDPHR